MGHDLLRRTRCFSGQPSNHTPRLSGGRELDWCRNYLSPFSQHSSPEQMPGAGSHSPPSWASATAKSSPGQRGSSCGRSRGAAPPLDSPMHVALSLPLARNLLCFFSANLIRLYMCRYRRPPMGGGKGTGPACSIFLSRNYTR